MVAYYNEHDPYAAAWLHNLIAAGHITAGDVDERSIADVRSEDLRGYTQCHFFAGIGGWSHALRLAGWSDDRPVWTGSCPCQPFSAAGQQKGTEDERHLWPEFRRLIAECSPATVFGEQVASRLGRDWLAGVRTDLEALGYAVGAADLCAAGVGAPHIRQRLWWVADADGGVVGDGHVQSGGEHGQQPQDNTTSWLGNAAERGPQGGVGRWSEAQGVLRGEIGQRRAVGAWADAATVHCTDGKTRRFEPGSFPLAHGAIARMGRLRAYGNAIVPQVAATFIRAGGK